MSNSALVRRIRRALDPLVAVIAVLVHSNVFIALSATSVAVTTMVLADLPIDLLALFIVFAVTLFVYSLDRVIDLDTDARNVPKRAAFVRRYGTIVLALGIGLYLIAIGVAIAWDLPRAEFLALPLIVVALYVAGGKQILLVKNLLVGLAWGIIPLGVGVYYGALWTVEILFLFAFVSVMLTVAAAIFDVKDIEGDRATGVRTIPVVYSSRATRVGAAAVTLVVATVVVGLVAAGVLDRGFLTLLGFLGYVLAYVPFATPDRGGLFYGFVVDGEHVFLAVLVLVTQT